jgi:hypothetical protein
MGLDDINRQRMTSSAQPLWLTTGLCHLRGGGADWQSGFPVVRTSLVVLLVCLGLATPAHATIINVPGDYPGIQAGLLACQAGDTVLVSAGTYLENITWPNTESICLQSVSGPDLTIIDGSNPSHPDSGSVIVFAAGQDTSTVLDGFTITRGTGTRYPPLSAYNGGGILCDGASPTIRNNVVTLNTQRSEAGAGIMCLNLCSPIIRRNSITENIANGPTWGVGGGIMCYGASATIVDNIISDNQGLVACGIGLETTSSIVTGNQITGNTALPGDSYGGGMHLYSDASTITGNVITGNQAVRGGGLRFSYSTPTIMDNVITGNTATANGGGIQSGWYTAPLITGNTISGNTAGGGVGAGIAYYFTPAATGDEGLPKSWDVHEVPRTRGLGSRSYGAIANNTIADNTGEGIRCSGGSPTIQGCLILDNDLGISCYLGAAPEIHWNDIAGHSLWGVANASGDLTVNAESNWWGHSSGPYHPVTNPNGLGDPVSGGVDYDPWLMQSTGMTEPAPVLPAVLMVSQNRPNPFNPVTTIEYVLPHAGEVTLRVYDVLGREVATLVKGAQSRGGHEISWDASGKASGVYYYRVEAGDWSATRPMVLLRR